MELEELTRGLQHVGLPTKDMEQTLDFYHRLGFEDALIRDNDGAKVVFLKLKNLVIEAYESAEATGVPGAIDHIAIDVSDIEAVFSHISSGGFSLLDQQVRYLPFWDNGVRFFTILGPNGEKIEFSQIL